MELDYDPDDLDKYFSKYEALKQDTIDKTIEYTGYEDRDEWEWDDVWAMAQTADDGYPVESLEEQEKLAEAAYYSVSDDIEHQEWIEARQRIMMPFTSATTQDITEFFPARFVEVAASEILWHAVTFDILGQAPQDHTY
ncbi:hypothetical protein ACFQE8_22480 [Salinirubellus sp. GCM10025818]|uniref:hypothetical protein n=1 Tax=Salinirubellus TaxID=2162630 RepID=UPI0030CCC21F